MAVSVDTVDLTRVYDLCKRIIEYYRYQLNVMKIDASGTLSKTADFDVEFDDYHMAVNFILESYYWYVEKGRNRSTGKFGSWTTKYKDIETWLKNKISRGSFIPRSGHTVPRTPKEIKSVSYAIATKINKVGFYGRTHYGKHPLQEALKQAEADGIIDEIVDLVVAGFDSRVDVEFEKI